MSFHIRTANLQDAGALAEIVRDLGFFEHLAAEPFEATRERVERHLTLCFADDSHSVYVAEDAQGELVGYTAVHWLPYLFLAGPEGYVSELFIKSELRGQGLGGRLLEVVKAEAQARGCARLILLNNRQRESYQRAFYAKNGWQERAHLASFVYPLV
jgi:GNAT superfamily N-acetyltransferase